LQRRPDELRAFHQGIDSDKLAAGSLHDAPHCIFEQPKRWVEIQPCGANHGTLDLLHMRRWPMSVLKVHAERKDPPHRNVVECGGEALQHQLLVELGAQSLQPGLLTEHLLVKLVGVPSWLRGLRFLLGGLRGGDEPGYRKFSPGQRCKVGPKTLIERHGAPPRSHTIFPNPATSVHGLHRFSSETGSAHLNPSWDGDGCDTGQAGTALKGAEYSAEGAGVAHILMIPGTRKYIGSAVRQAGSE
jgi:hypothetical protein